jgi:hypothetical protein
MSGLYAGMSTKDREKILLNLLGSQRPVLVPSGLVIPAQWKDEIMDREEPTELHAALEPPVTTAALEAGRIEPEPEAAHPRWIRPIGDYDRRETTVVEGLRYG